MRKKLTSLYVDPAVLRRLKTLSLRTKIPMQIFLREAVDWVLGKYKA
jgi:hypothetical protein